jgi:hypothetical protein
MMMTKIIEGSIDNFIGDESEALNEINYCYGEQKKVLFYCRGLELDCWYREIR